MERTILTVSGVLSDIAALPQNYKTADVDALIKRYVRENADVSALREHILEKQELHRIYYHTALKQIKNADDRLLWIDKNLLFSDWWHTDQLIDFVKDADFDAALELARSYVNSEDPFIRRWGYVMFISKLCRSEERFAHIFGLLHDDEHYYVQMGEAWLIAELAVFFPERTIAALKNSGLKYDISGKAIQKICDSFRVNAQVKEGFKALRPIMKARDTDVRK